MTGAVLRLLAAARPASGRAISAGGLVSLPAPVARYLSLAGIAGKRPPRTVYLHQTGTMRTAPAKPWSTLAAEQWFSLDPPAFLWRGVMRAGLLRIAATDSFLDGRGRFRISAWDRIPLSTMSGPETDSGELLRFLVEAVWFPAFWLSPLVQWSPVDACSARVSLRVNATEVASTIRFGNDGLPNAIEAERYRTLGRRFELTPWRGRCEDYREAEGVLIPHRISVTWGLPQGDFEWLRISLDCIEYE